MRVSISKSTNAEQVYIIHSFRDRNGKSTSKIFKKLGSMDQLLPLHDNDRNKVIAWAKQQAKLATDSYKKENETISIPFHPNMQIKLNEQRNFNCGYLCVRASALVKRHHVGMQVLPALCLKPCPHFVADSVAHPVVASARLPAPAPVP